MKGILITWIILTGILQSVSQSQDWKVIEPPYNNPVKLLYQSGKGYLFSIRIKTDYYDEFSISKDNGITNNPLSSTNNIHLSALNANYFFEGPSKNTYFYQDKTIFEIDINSLKIKTLITCQETILDVSFLKTGDIMVGTKSKLLLYSNTGVLIKIFQWNISQCKILPDEMNQINLIPVKINNQYYLLESTDDLSNLITMHAINETVFGNLFRIGDRLFSTSFYSDDFGNTWKNIALPDTNVTSFFINLGHDKTLLIRDLDSNKIFLSSDKGATFVTMTIPDKNVNYYSRALNGDLVIYYSQDCDRNITYISKDLGESWYQILQDQRSLYKFSLKAGVNENIFTEYCDDFYYKEGENIPWKILQLKDSVGVQINISSILPLSDSSVIAITTAGEIIKLTENGKSWEKWSENKLPSVQNRFIEKKGILYLIQDTEFYSSNDLGKNWYTIPLKLYPWITLKDDEYCINNISEIFYFGEFGIIHFIPLTNEIIDNQIHEWVLSAETSFDGNILYFASVYFGVPIKYYFNISYDKGQTFSRILIDSNTISQFSKIKTDHQNNIYVYSENKVFLSNDQGNSWQNITPDFPELISINDMQISYDNNIYLATTGAGILKYDKNVDDRKKIEIKIVDDANNDCIADDSEKGLKNIKIKLNNNYIQETDSTGRVTFLTHSDDNIISLLVDTTFFQLCDNEYQVTFDTLQTYIELFIPLKVLKTCIDIKTGISIAQLRRCTKNIYHGSVCNTGNIKSDDTEILFKLDPYFSFVKTNLEIIEKTDSTILCNAGTLYPGDCQSFNFAVFLKCSTPLGKEHCLFVETVNSDSPCDTSLISGFSTDCQKNIGSYDPNNKTVFINGIKDKVSMAQDDKLEYLIRFQNIGTDTAFVVRIEDKISPFFDILSIKPVDASHDYTFRLTDRTLIVEFNDIKLVDSFSNEPLSHGFVKFEIKLDSLTGEGVLIENQAAIYFDNNDPVFTNTVYSKVGQLVANKESEETYISLVPNPNTGKFFVVSDSARNYEIQIFDFRGILIKNLYEVNSNDKIDISDLAYGIYFLRLKYENETIIRKLIKL